MIDDKHQKDREILETVKRLVGAGADVYIRQRITAEEVANHRLILRTDGPVQIVYMNNALSLAREVCA